VTSGTGHDVSVGSLSVDEFGYRLRSGGLGLRIGPFNARIATDIEYVIEPLYRLYADHPVLDDPAVYSFRLSLNRVSRFPGIRPRNVRLLVDGRQPHEDMPIAHALPVLEWGANLVTALRCYCFLMFHAAVLERGGRALVLPASPGDGKTTLSAGLSHRGWRLFSDEFGLVRPGTTAMIPMPRPMALKNESIEIIKRFAPDAYLGPSVPGTRKGTVAHVKPPSASVAQQHESARVSVVVFPRWVAGEKFSLEEIPRAEGFMRLAANAFNYEVHGEAGFGTVRDIISGSRCYRLVYSDLDTASQRLTEMIVHDA
jgi:HprK-related kinase A